MYFSLIIKISKQHLFNFRSLWFGSFLHILANYNAIITAVIEQFKLVGKLEYLGWVMLSRQSTRNFPCRSSEGKLA